ETRATNRSRFCLCGRRGVMAAMSEMCTKVAHKSNPDFMRRDFMRRQLKVVFVAFLLEEQGRFLLQEGKFADLRARDVSLFGALSGLPADERQAVIGYLQSAVPLKDFEQAA